MQRRALDAARSKLGSLTDRDAILDCFFEHSRGLFHFAVLFVVRGDTAQGRNVHGLGAPDGLVERLSVPLDEPSVLSRAREYRRPLIGVTSMTPIDGQLFGTLGRTMPGGLVVPLVVRDRVVAILLGDGAAEPLVTRAQEAGRTGIELAKEEMLLWAEYVGEALEKLILRAKKPTGSVPPPRFASSPPPRFAAAPLPARVPQDLAIPGASILSDATATASPEPSAKPKSSSFATWLTLVAVVLVSVAVGWWKLGRTPADAGLVVVAGKELAGWPAAVDPAAAMEVARGASGLGASAELGSLHAEVSKGGTVDLSGAPKPDEGTPLVFTFVEESSEVELRVDREGMHAPRRQQRRMCSDKPCRASVPAPHCSLSQVWDAARTVGLRDEDRAAMTYASGEGVGPHWVVALTGRGQVRVDAATCQPMPRERLRPSPLPLSSAPGAPGGVDPIAAAEIAHAQSGLDKDAVLVEIDAEGVGSSGKVSFAEGSDGAILYTFADPQEVPAKARRWRQVELGREGFRVVADEVERGPLAAQYDPLLSEPRCDFAHAFAYMTLEGGSVTTARVTYGSDLVSHNGKWSLALPGGGTRPSISDLECEAWAGLHSADAPEVAPAPSAAAKGAGASNKRAPR